MAETWGHQITLPGLSVNADLSAYQFHFVKFASTTNMIKNLAATTDIVVGILQDTPNAAGAAAKVAGLGVSLVVAGTAVIAAGDLLTPNSTGRAKLGGVRGYAQALEPATANGDEIRCLIIGRTA